MPRSLRITLTVLLALAALVAAGGWLASDPRPTGTTGPDADALARSLQASVNGEAWQRTGAVRWNFDGRHDLLWDRTRGLVEVRWGDTRVLRRVGDTRGALAFESGEALTGDAHAAAVDKAYALWANDSFWLNPLEKLFDDGVTRAVWTGPHAERGLLVTYGSGGVTPGDSYLWLMDDEGRPRAWRMWVKIIPIGGLTATWEGWQRLTTGAQVSTAHRVAGMTLRLLDVKAAATLRELTGGDDPFAALVSD